MQLSRRIFPFIQRVFADSGYAGEKVAKATLGSSRGSGAIDDWQGTSRPPSTPHVRSSPAASHTTGYITCTALTFLGIWGV